MIADLIKKMSALEAEAQLKFNTKRAALPILKLLKSGVASAVNNFNLSPESLYVANIFVNEGPMLKRFRARAFGRAGAIQKKTSHITLVLEERAILGGKKSRKKPAVKKEIKAEAETMKTEIKKENQLKPFSEPKEIKPTRKTGSFARRIFRRKAIG